jgi:hypothetical protein
MLDIEPAFGGVGALIFLIFVMVRAPPPPLALGANGFTGELLPVDLRMVVLLWHSKFNDAARLMNGGAQGHIPSVCVKPPNTVIGLFQ